MSDVSTISSAMRADRRSAARARRGCPRSTDRSGASGCGRRVSLNRRTSAAWLASRKISTGLRPRHLAQLPEHLRERRQESALAHVDDDRDLVDVAAGAQRQLRQRRNQRRRQVVDAEVAEILERADRLRLARAGQAGEDDERRAAAGWPPRPRLAPARASPARPPRLDRLRRRRRPRRLDAARRAAQRVARAARRARAPRDGRARAAAGCAPRLRRGSRCCGPGATGIRISGTRRPRIS